MRSVAEQLRRQTRVRVLEMPVMARIGLALRLGDDDLALYLGRERLDRDEARRRLRAQRAHGRRPSRAAQRDGP